MQLRKIACAAAVAVLSASPVAAQNYNLTFSGLSGTIPNSYGDVAGVVDVTFGHRSTWGNGSFSPNGYYWYSGYNDLFDVMYTQNGAGVGEVQLDNLAAGQTITLNSSDVGSWSYATTTVELRVYDFAWNLLYSNVGATVGSTAHASFSPGASDLNGLYVQWSRIDTSGNPVDAYNTGIDNVDFTVASAVPEPASVVLLATGLMGVAAAARRRRA